MRFALRNQTKIKNAIGEELFSELMEAIKETFTERCDTDILVLICKIILINYEIAMKYDCSDCYGDFDTLIIK